MEYNHSNSRNTKTLAWVIVKWTSTTVTVIRLGCRGQPGQHLHNGCKDNHVQQDCRNSIVSFEHPCLLVPFLGLDMACANYSFVNRVLVHILHISKKWMCVADYRRRGFLPPDISRYSVKRPASSTRNYSSSFPEQSLSCPVSAYELLALPRISNISLLRDKKTADVVLPSNITELPAPEVTKHFLSTDVNNTSF